MLRFARHSRLAPHHPASPNALPRPAPAPPGGPAGHPAGPAGPPAGPRGGGHGAGARHRRAAAAPGGRPSRRAGRRALRTCCAGLLALELERPPGIQGARHSATCSTRPLPMGLPLPLHIAGCRRGGPRPPPPGSPPKAALSPAPQCRPPRRQTCPRWSCCWGAAPTRRRRTRTATTPCTRWRGRRSGWAWGSTGARLRLEGGAAPDERMLRARAGGTNPRHSLATCA